jgi:Mg-chelatase subunit ChlD
MRKRIKSIIIIFALFTLVFTGASRPLSEQLQQSSIVLQITQVDTSEFPLIHVYISVRDAQGEPLPINPGRLVLKENGVAVNAEDIMGSNVVNELTSLLVMDVSGSMNFAGKLEAAKDAARDYIKQLRAQDQTGIITFNTKVAVANPVTLDNSTLLKAIDKIQANGDTAMYDALIKAVEILNPLSGRKAIIVLTDGMDNSSKSTPEEVLRSIGYTGLSISTIGLGIIPDGETQPDKFKGRYGFVEDKQSLSELYDQMRRALQSEIVITYTTPQKLRDGVSRSLTVELVDDLTGVGTSGEKQFNPGGLVPEVAKPISWITFGVILIVLVIFLFLPWVIGVSKNIGNKSKKKTKSRIKLLD